MAAKLIIKFNKVLATTAQSQKKKKKKKKENIFRYF